MSSRLGLLIGLAGMSLSGGCSSGLPETDLTVDTLPGGAVRTISSRPMEWADSSGWRLELERMIQPPDDSPAMLSAIRQLLVLPGGGIVVADGSPARIVAFPAADDSTPVTVALPGSGPGEVSEPRLALLGDTILAHSPMLSRLSLFGSGGALLGELRIPTSHIGAPISVDRLGRIWIVDAAGGSRLAPLQQWVRYDLAGNRLDSLGMPTATAQKVWQLETVTFPVPYSSSTSRLVLADGNILFGSTDRDEFFVTRSGLDTLKIFGRSGAIPHTVSESDRDSALARYSQMPRLAEVANRADIPSVKPLWLGLYQDGTGDIWVHRRPAVAGARGTAFDVYDATGKYRGAVSAPFSSIRLAWSATHLAVADEDLDGFPRIRVYRIMRGS